MSDIKLPNRLLIDWIADSSALHSGSKLCINGIMFTIKESKCFVDEYDVREIIEVEKDT